MDAIPELLEGAGLVEQYTDEGKDAMRFTRNAARVAPQMAMSEDQDGLLDALLASGGDTKRPAPHGTGLRCATYLQ